MPCIVPTCAASVGTFKLFPRHKSLSERWLDAIHTGCGVKADDDDHSGRMEMCQWHFGKPDPAMPYQEPKIFVNRDGQDVEIESCRLCLRFYPSCEMVSRNGKLGGIEIKSNVYESLRIAFLANDFLDLVCTQCLARLELLQSIQKDFLQTEMKFQQLIKISQQSLAEVIVEQEEPEPALKPVCVIIEESANQLLDLINQEVPTKIFVSKEAERKEPFVPFQYWADTGHPDERDLRGTSNKCYICSAVLADANELVLHLTEKHSTKGVYRCDECSIDFPVLAAYNRHLARHDKSERPVKCSICPLRFKSFETMTIHEIKNHRMKDKLKMDQPNEKPRQLFVCEICGKECASLKWHIQRMHSDYKKPSCSICEKTFATQSTLERHMLVHTDTKPYSCDQCGASFRRLLKLRHHIQKDHEGKNPYICVECNLEFNNDVALYIHKRTVHRNITSNPTTNKPRCAICSAENTTLAELKQHIETFHTNEVYPYVQCPHCPRSFLATSALASHKGIHSDRFACKQCGKRHNCNQTLRNHMESAHPDGTRYDCPICIGKTYKTKESLQGHMRVHAPVKRHACDICSKAFFRKCHLTIHRRTHTGEKPYACKHCSRRFSDFSSYRKHERRCAEADAKKPDQDEGSIAGSNMLMNMDVSD